MSKLKLISFSSGLYNEGGGRNIKAAIIPYILELKSLSHFHKGAQWNLQEWSMANLLHCIPKNQSMMCFCHVEF